MRLKEFSTLSEAMGEAEEKIDEGMDTSATQLDRYLSTRVAFYRWMAHHPHPDHPPDERERNAEWYLRYQRVLNGSYHVEKANFALETARLEKKNADKREEAIYNPDTDEPTRERYKLFNAKDRKVAANWFRTAANCLTMPEEGRTKAPEKPGE